MKITTCTDKKNKTHTEHPEGLAKQKYSNKMQALLDSDFIGSGEGLEDLSTNYKEYLYKGLKKKH